MNIKSLNERSGKVIKPKGIGKGLDILFAESEEDYATEFPPEILDVIKELKENEESEIGSISSEMYRYIYGICDNIYSDKKELDFLNPKSKDFVPLHIESITTKIRNDIIDKSLQPYLYAVLQMSFEKNGVFLNIISETKDEEDEYASNDYSSARENLRYISDKDTFMDYIEEKIRSSVRLCDYGILDRFSNRYQFRMNGLLFLNDIIEDNYRDIRDGTTSEDGDKINNGISVEVVNQLTLLKSEVNEVFGEEYEDLVYVLFYIMEGNIDELSLLIFSQSIAHKKACKNYDKEGKPEEKKHHFFSHLFYFLEVYSDISQYLREYCQKNLIYIIERN